MYDAFISYSHAKDKPVAAALQSVIQKLGKPWYRRRGLRVFRDDTSLSATPQLWPSIEQALARSRYLIVLASPEAAASPWVAKEVEYWLTHKSADTLFIGLTGGALDWDGKQGDFTWSADTPLPKPLEGRFAAEPKWIDLRPYRAGAEASDARFIELGADFAAAIHGMPKEDLLSQEVRQQRRALTLAVGAAGVMLLLAIGAVTAGVIARYQADRAERNFATATETVKGLIFDVTQGLRDIEGMHVESLEKILGQTRKAVERLTESDPKNLKLLYAKAAMLNEFAKTQIDAGDRDAALENADEALAVLQRIGEITGPTAELLRQVASARILIGDARSSKGNIPGALDAYEKSLDIARHLPEADAIFGLPQAMPDPEYYLITALERVAGMKRHTGDSKGALAAYDEGLSLMRRVAQKDEANPQLKREVATLLGFICDLKHGTGDVQAALDACNEAFAITRRTAAVDQGNTEWQRDVAVGLERIGHLKRAAGDGQGAFEAFDESLGIRLRLSTLDPGNAGWRRDLAIGYSLVGTAKQALGESSAAIKSYEESLSILAELIENHPDSSELLQDMSISLDKLGSAKVAASDIAGARAAYEKRLEIARQVAAIDPSNLEWQRSVALGLKQIGIMRNAAGDQAGALAAYDESLAIARKIAAADPDNIMRQPDVEIVLGKLAQLRLAAGDRAGALAAYEEALEIAQRMAEAFPDKAVWQTTVRETRETIEDLKRLGGVTDER